MTDQMPPEPEFDAELGREMNDLNAEVCVLLTSVMALVNSIVDGRRYLAVLYLRDMQEHSTAIGATTDDPEHVRAILDQASMAVQSTPALTDFDHPEES